MLARLWRFRVTNAPISMVVLYIINTLWTSKSMEVNRIFEYILFCSLMFTVSQNIHHSLLIHPVLITKWILQVWAHSLLKLNSKLFCVTLVCHVTSELFLQVHTTIKCKPCCPSALGTQHMVAYLVLYAPPGSLRQYIVHLSLFGKSWNCSLLGLSISFMGWAARF